MSSVSIDTYDASTGKPIVFGRALNLANQQYPHETKHATAQRRAFIKGYMAAVNECVETPIRLQR